MKGIFSVKITDEGEYWYKEIRIFGVLVYSRHDFTHENKRRQIGFNSLPYSPIEIDDDYYEE